MQTLTRKSHVKILFSKGILTGFPTVFPSPTNKFSSNSLPFSSRVLSVCLFVFQPPFRSSLSGVSNKKFGWLSDLNGILWGGNHGLNPRIVDPGIFLLFLLLSSSSFPLGCHFHQVLGNLRTWARKNTQGDGREETLGFGVFLCPRILLHAYCIVVTKAVEWAHPTNEEFTCQLS